jgi:hypothetical protein
MAVGFGICLYLEKRRNMGIEKSENGGGGINNNRRGVSGYRRNGGERRK